MAGIVEANDQSKADESAPCDRTIGEDGNGVAGVRTKKVGRRFRRGGPVAVRWAGGCRLSRSGREQPGSARACRGVWLDDSEGSQSGCHGSAVAFRFSRREKASVYGCTAYAAAQIRNSVHVASGCAWNVRISHFGFPFR